MFIIAVFIKYNQKTYDARLRLATNTILRILAIRNSYPKYVVSLDEWTSGSITDGIQHLHLATFLQMDL